MRFSDFLGQVRSQSELDFVDIALGRDMKVFIDPYALATTQTPWCENAHSLAWGLFQRVLRCLHAGDRAGAVDLLSHLHEDNRTRLGYSDNRPQGTGFGGDHAAPFLEALERSRAFQTGQIQDLETAALLVDGIGLDIVSDMITNVVREQLALYTQDQCRLLGIPLAKLETFEAWREEGGWTRVTMELPTDGTRAIILVPRAVVRKDLSLVPGQYLTDFLDHQYEAGNPNAIAALERMVQIVPTKRRGKEVHRDRLRDDLAKKGSKKSVMSRLTDDCPEALEGYKDRARRNRPVLDPIDLENIHPEGRRDVNLANLVAEMRDAARNADDVMALAGGVTAASVAAFHPFLQHPRRLEGAVNGFAGVVMANVAPNGILWRARHQRAGDCPNVVVLATTEPITPAILSHVDPVALRTTSAAGAVLVVGASVDAGVRHDRPRLAGLGVLVMAVSELAEIAEVDAGPGASLDALERLVAA